MSDSYPNEYIQFFESFNRGEYYDCHDFLEEIWMREKDNKFLQGLLQMAVAIYHFECGNIKGSRLLFESAHRYLKDYLPSYWGLDLQPIISYIEECLDVLPEADRWPVERLSDIPFPYIRLPLPADG